jgi:5-methylcytosine-specific restriction enzyme subunit McrC
MKGCDQTILVYPAALSEPMDVPVRDVRVRSMTFGLDGNLEERGREFPAGLLDAIDQRRPQSMGTS